MNEKFELIYGYIHCRGKTTYSAGFVDTEKEAHSWLLLHEQGKCPPPKVPPNDPLRYCEAAFCPFKRQKPWFDIVKIHHQSAEAP
jgi:hypothetical protein